MTRKFAAIAIAGLLVTGVAARSQSLTTGDLVISTVSLSVSISGTQTGLDTAAPIVLDQFRLSASGTSATADGSLTLPQTSSGNNSAISGEYGSASEGILQQSVNGRYLTIMGYGVNANTFNSAPTTTYGTAALGQSTSLTAAAQTGGTVYTTVPRVVGLISANGTVDTSTALTGVFNNNNPRSAATIDGSSFYVSGQGASEGDSTEGVAYAALGATTATVIDNSTDTRVVSVLNNGSGNALYVSRDVKVGGGNNNLTNISLLAGAGGSLPTSSAGLTTTHIIPPASPNSLGGNNGSVNVTTADENGINNARGGSFVYLSPEQYFLASPTVMYVADSGQPKNGNANAAALGEGGLQKWVLTSGTWTLDYDLVAGLNLANNATADSTHPTNPGVTGLFGLTGETSGDSVELFATSYGLNELSSSYLYEITDDLGATSISDPNVASEAFSTLYSAPSGTSIRGVSFAPQAVPEPGTWGMAAGGLGLLLAYTRSRRARAL